MIDETILENALKATFAGIKFTEQPAGLYDPLRYMMSIGGKRIRPRLCLLSYSLFKDALDESILEPATALEVFHTFTLIHDDIMDRSEMRRGMPTVWKKWNADTAILSGDVMSIESYRRLAKAPREVLPEVLDVFTKTAAQVCDGQQLDMDFESIESIPMEDYMNMVGLKTGVLIAASAKIGALIGGATPEQADKLYTYGYKLGLAFQIADDYLDAYGDASVFGKPIGGDIVNNKKSWLQVRALEDPRSREDVLRIMAMDASDEATRKAKISAMMDVYERISVGPQAQEQIGRITAEALETVRDFGGYALLEQYAESLVGRVR